MSDISNDRQWTSEEQAVLQERNRQYKRASERLQDVYKDTPEEFLKDIKRVCSSLRFYREWCYIFVVVIGCSSGLSFMFEQSWEHEKSLNKELSAQVATLKEGICR